MILLICLYFIVPSQLSVIFLEETLDLIAIYEDIINDDLSIENINSLLSLYQKAIEYFSAIDSGRFEDFLNRNKKLLSREDVQMVLNSVELEGNINIAILLIDKCIMHCLIIWFSFGILLLI